LFLLCTESITEDAAENKAQGCTFWKIRVKQATTILSGTYHKEKYRV
jgi:hypothetical protein